MTKAHHTPGPWKAQRDIRHYTNNGTLHDGSPKAWAVYGKGTLRACIAESIGVPWDQDTEAEADARLIAAAPDLLETLEQIARIAAPGQEMDLPTAIDALCDCWTHARAVIAKARGE